MDLEAVVALSLHQRPELICAVLEVVVDHVLYRVVEGQRRVGWWSGCGVVSDAAGDGWLRALPE